VISNTTKEDINKEIDNRPLGIALSSSSSNVNIVDITSITSSSSYSYNAFIVFSVNNKACLALVLTPSSRQSLSTNFNNLSRSSFYIASTSSPS
jgi:hypothetical protein